MSEIKMLNLFRCSSAEDTEEDIATDKKVNYFVTDYFDGIKIEDLNFNDTTLAECMGIKYNANRKRGVSHQRYCLYARENSEDIFEQSDEYPLLTVIQIFINPDSYQAEGFADGSEISGENWIKKLKCCIETCARAQEVRWKLYQLLTAGDFAVIVRSKKAHAAYDIVTTIRGIRLVVDGSGREKAAFYSYSICGVLDSSLSSGPSEKCMQWQNYLEPKDRVIIRIKYAQAFRQWMPAANALKQKMVQEGMHLLGRYDHQFVFTPEEFQQLYPFIRLYKFKTHDGSKVSPEHSTNEKVALLIEMMRKRYISHINEKLLLNYDKDQLLEGQPREKWELHCKKPWRSLYAVNNERMNDIKKDVSELEEMLRPYYQSARNLKEYIRLAGRLCRVLYEINKLQELRVSAAKLLVQYKDMIVSLRAYVSQIQKEDAKKYAEVIEKNLWYGIGALEIFTRYIRNVNLQTLQTPNYDLQTNMCVEKVLLAYSQFLQPYMTQKEQPYYLTETLYPIIVPSMGVRDLSVMVLFNGEASGGREERDAALLQKLMVVFSPTFYFLCESCFLIPAVFHEIAHQFRYEERSKRNDCLKQYVLKKFLHAVILDMLDQARAYDFKDTAMVEKLVDTVYDRALVHLTKETDADTCLRQYKEMLKFRLAEFIAVGTVQDGLAAAHAKKYLDRTKGNIQRYDSEVLEAIQKIDEMLAKVQRAEQKLVQRNVSGETDKDAVLGWQMGLKCAVRKLKILQEHQIYTDIQDQLRSAGLKELAKRYKAVWSELKWEEQKRFCIDGPVTAENLQKVKRFLNNSSSEKAGEEAFAVWNEYESTQLNKLTAEEKRKLRHLLKQYHNINMAYRYFNSHVMDMALDEKRQDLQKKRMSDYLVLQKLFKDLCSVMYEELQNSLKSFAVERRNRLNWNTIAMPVEQLDFIRKEIRLGGETEICRKVSSIFQDYGGGKAENLVDQSIEFYREVTSDLFMCAMMELDVFGYLVVATEILKFETERRERQVQRVSVIAQCLLASGKEDSLTAEQYVEEIERRMISEAEILQREICKTAVFQNTGETESGIVCQKLDSLDEISKFLTEYSEKKEFTSTQQWIIRVYRQILAIIRHMRKGKMCKETIGDKEMWKDIISDQAYYSRKEELRRLLSDNGGDELCKSITEILNSPARFFSKKKSILWEEIEFLLSQYEKSCKNIF